MIREIGSEFEYMASGHKNNGTDGLFFPEAEDRCFCFCGRTAIETVLLDVRGAGKACLPSYCCDSMIEPFRRAGIEVSFYRVIREDRGIDFLFDEIPSDADIILYCNYFGFAAPYLPPEIADRVHAGGGIILEDATQSILSRHAVHAESDYFVASLRKWFPTPSGGICAKRRGTFSVRPRGEVSGEFLASRCEAMRIKERYGRTADPADKEVYRRLYGEANHWLESHYTGLAADGETLAWLASADLEDIRSRRRKNAEVLLDGLAGIRCVKPLFAREQMDCPLFLPVTVDRERRTMVRQALIDEAVYCPVHWPRPEADCDSELYDTELSLICDQRYDEADMERILSVLRLQG